ncbi:hypothetical protein JCM21900_000940 [Sporobolomyces salmonicolor]
MPFNPVTVEEGTLELPAGPTLAYSLHFPTATSRSDLRQAALIAHPYGRLGGSRHDHVVVALAELLVEEGWLVCRYDSRGAGDSTGSGSWTGAPEAEDYQRILLDVLLPLLSPSSASSAAASVESAAPTTYDLLLCGYSFGSLAASFCLAPSPTSTASFRTRCLLVSYPVSVLWALCSFRHSTFTTALRTTIQKGEYRTLAIFGDGDQFSSVGKFRRWSNELGKYGGSTGCWQAVEIEGADHFWGDPVTKRELLEVVRAWLRA